MSEVRGRYLRKRSSLLYLLPYLKRYRAAVWLGFVMIACTVAAGMVSPWILKYVVDDIQIAFAPERLPRYAALIVGISVVEGFFRYWMRKILIGVSRQIEYDLRNDFFAHLQRMSLSFFQTHSTGDIMSRATNDLNAVRSVLGPGIMYSVTTVITAVIITFILLRLNWQLTVLAYIPLVLASLSVKQIGQQIHDRFEEIQEQFSHISTHVQESLSGIRVVKAFAREASEIDSFEKLNREYVRRSVSLIRLWGLFYPLLSALIGLSAAALLWYGGREVIAGKLTLGEFVAFLAYISLLTWPTIATGWVINIFQRGSASMDRILRILRTEPDIRDLPGSCAPQEIRGGLEIRDLSFRYPNSERWVLRDINVTLPPGQTLAIVGQTGAGKSTLIQLIARLFDPAPGTVFIDGRDVRQWPLQDLRRVIGCVPQETFLFSDTIRANVVFGSHDRVGEQETERAVRAAAVDDDIRNFPDGLQTFVGERGITLSGGQKQRIAMGRALIREPKLLILDDALSSVDTYTEERILQNLQEITRSRTTIIVSHRISTVRGAHQIIVLQDGAIVERGDHEMLMSRGGAYAALYQKQLLEEELATA